MKADIVKTVIAFVASALIAYGMYSWCVSDKAVLLCVVSFLEIFILLFSAIGLRIEWMRSMVNVKIVSWAFFIALLAMNIVFSRTEFSTPVYVLSNGGSLLLFVLITYSLIKANNN